MVRGSISDLCSLDRQHRLRQDLSGRGYRYYHYLCPGTGTGRFLELRSQRGALGRSGESQYHIRCCGYDCLYDGQIDPNWDR